MDYEAVSAFSKSWGLVYLAILFLAVLVYAFWPGNQSKFDRAARAPLNEEAD
ncbi:MAG: cbb3-type cytochrome c oxidase subunit 3 [Maricaulaceae bacterium]